MLPFVAALDIIRPSLPPQCEPANHFLYSLSATFHTCVPTNLAFLSSVLGTCSIVAWLFAQLPQIYKNHKLKSTSGLSIFFLAEWLAGDLGNLLGSLLLKQALWQVIIAGYYVTVDCALVGQWIWYEVLKHGRPLRSIWKSDRTNTGGGSAGGGIMEEVRDSLKGTNASTSGKSAAASTADKPSQSPNPAYYVPHRSNPMDAFRIPNFARSPSGPRNSPGAGPNTNTPPSRTVHRPTNSPMPSPKTLLYISLLLAVLSNSVAATPISPFAPPTYPHHPLTARPTTPVPPPTGSRNTAEIAGKFLSWTSTVLYLGSRLPQLYKNHVRRSTAGLSPTLFLAAFFGNLFYSTSLLTNPCAWHDFAPGEGRGWVGPQGSDSADWILRATPFFLGAAGVLVMDALVGFQFCVFGDGTTPSSLSAVAPCDEEEVFVVVNEGGMRKRIHRRWRRASGWMRGWMPSVSVAGTPSVSRAATPVQTPRSESPTPSQSSARSWGAASRARSMGGALEEARALLGTSPRSYGTGT